MRITKLYLGQVPNSSVKFLEHIATNTNLNVLDVMEKLNLGDPNRIYVAKILTKGKKINKIWTKQ